MFRVLYVLMIFDDILVLSLRIWSSISLFKQHQFYTIFISLFPLLFQTIAIATKEIFGSHVNPV